MNLLKFRKPSRYINHEVNSISRPDAPVRVALAFPDVYEIGMSHLGLRILYHIINGMENALSERVYAPWPDMKEHLDRSGEPLRSLETGRPLKEFDILGFSLQYELSYPTVLWMLKLSGIPLLREERGDKYPVIIGGGPCTANPAPLERFFDAFLIGDGEEAVVEMVSIFHSVRSEGGGKEDVLNALSEIDGFYVPGVSKETVRRRYIKSLDDAPFPVSFPVPYTQIVHDRVNIEISRGCTRGCRFCQAGMIYRPLRERSPHQVIKLVEESLKNTGYDEVSFTSLSAGDYTNLHHLLRAINNRFAGRNISLSLPSLRVGGVSREILREIRHVKKTGFTIAPEAGTERLRSVINKDFNAEDYERALKALFSEGWLNLKLYFMLGLPTETDQDIEAITEMVQLALRTSRRLAPRQANITVGASPFVPKPHTPFQWVGMEEISSIERKLSFLKEKLPKKGVKFKPHDTRMSLLEAVLSRGGEETADLLLAAVEGGAYLDGWSEHFDFSGWLDAFDKTGLSPDHLASRTFEKDSPLPWDQIDAGPKKGFLWKEYERAVSTERTSDCNHDRCHGCGMGCNPGEYLSRPVPMSFRVETDNLKRFSPIRVRVEFEKVGDLAVLSHLELITTLVRGLRRASVPLVYTEGYSPSPKLSFGPPLNVGVEGLREYFDMEVYPPFDIQKNMELINKHLPQGLRVKGMAFVFGKQPSLTSFITLYEYEVEFKNKDKVNLGFLLKGKGRFSENLKKFDIIGDKRVKIELLDRPEKKVKLRDMLEGLFGMPMEDMAVRRTALYGYRKGWFTPMELLRGPGRPESSAVTV
ncbi:MAG: DUF2344 domain-containing protein [Nitrospirae bacterium]|nr:MAG: DUF2344 domain-containing protein [Nitrospirota bacterium]